MNGALRRKLILTLFAILGISSLLYMTDTEGVLIAYSAASGKVKRKSISLEPIKNSFLLRTRFSRYSGTIHEMLMAR